MGAISPRNEITIPADIMQEAGLVPGDDVRVLHTGPGRIEVVRTTDLIDSYAGSFDETAYPHGYLDKIR
jgi:antitoxin component of MazEF toxin-antitoxin module